MPAPAPISLDEFLLALTGVTARGDQWMARCPAHDDRQASLSVSVGEKGHIVAKCFAGCTFDQIAAALGYAPAQLCAPTPDERPVRRREVAAYDYRDAEGVLRFQVVRFIPKDFRQRRPDGAGGWIWKMDGVKKTLYRLNELQGHATVFVVEGEKDCDALWALGYAATSNAGGSSTKWTDEYSHSLAAAGVVRVALIPDNDAPGRKHMDDVARSVKAVGIAVMPLVLPGLEKKGADVSDWLALGHTKADLDALIAAKFWVVPKSAVVEPGGEPIDPDHDPAKWRLSELGTAETFVQRDGENIRYDNLQERWLVWAKHIWRPDADSAVYRLAHAHIRECQVEAARHVPDRAARERIVDFMFKLEQRSKIENVIAISRTLKPVADTGEDWDLNPWLMGVGNGVLDLKTGTVRDGERADRLTLHTSTDFLGDAECPRWLQFLADIFEGDSELIAYVQRALGYSLTGDMREQCFFMCVGGGSNGKSTFTSTLEAVWGRYAYTTDMRTFTTQPHGADTGFDIAELAQRRLILASETKTDSRLNEQALKNFTGGEKMNAQRKYGHPFEYAPTGKIWLGLNHQPRVKDDSFGFWRRVRIIPFLRIFSGSMANPNMRAELIAEAPGILRWSVEGCLDWLKVGLQQPASVYNATDAYRESEDPLNDFILDRCECVPEWNTTAAEMYKGYVAWALDQGMSQKEAMTANAFGRLFIRRFDRRRTLKGISYVGVRLQVKQKDLAFDQS